MDIQTTLLYCLYIYRYKVKWCKGDGLVMWQIFSSFRCKKIILLMLMRWVQTTPSFLFSTVPVFVIVCSTMVLPASCLMGSPVRRGQLRDILRREPASCPACHFREIWYWGSTWWCTCQNRFWVYPWASLSMRLQWCLASWDAVCSACSIYEHDGNIDFLSEWQLSSMTRMVLSANWRTEICASWSSCSLCWSRCS